MKIEKDIPVPDAYRPRTDWTRAAAAMAPGDSILCESENIARTLRYALYSKGGKATIRKVEGGWRVWKIE